MVEDKSTQPISLGIVSTAAILGKVLPGLKTFTSIVGVSSREKARAETFAQDHGVGVGFTHDELFSEGVDALYIPLPSGVRNEMVSKAIDAGKHVYLEKPMAGSVEEIAGLVARAAEKGVQWMDGTMWYHSARTKAIKEKLESGAIGKVQRMTAAFTFVAPSEEWLHGGNCRTDSTLEPMGCLGDQGWYPISAILWAFEWELPEKVLSTSVVFNRVDTIVSCTAVLFFSGGRVATFDAGCTAAYRSQYEIVGEKGRIRVDDLVGGQGRSGRACKTPFVGSGSYVLGDAMGKDEVVQVEPSDHVNDVVKAFTSRVKEIQAGGQPDSEWPKRSLAVHTVMSAVFASCTSDGSMIQVLRSS